MSKFAPNYMKTFLNMYRHRELSANVMSTAKEFVKLLNEPKSIEFFNTAKDKTPFFIGRAHFCTTNLRMVIFRSGSLYSLCSPGNHDYQKIIKFLTFFKKKGRNWPSKFDNQKYISLSISPIKIQLLNCPFRPF